MQKGEYWRNICIHSSIRASCITICEQLRTLERRILPRIPNYNRSHSSQHDWRNNYEDSLIERPSSHPLRELSPSLSGMNTEITEWQTMNSSISQIICNAAQNKWENRICLEYAVETVSQVKGNTAPIPIDVSQNTYSKGSYLGKRVHANDFTVNHQDGNTSNQARA